MKELATYCIGLLVTCITFIVTLQTQLFSFATDSDPIVAILGSFCIATLAFLVTDRIACTVSHKQALDGVLKMLKSWHDELPHVSSSTTRFESSEKAFEYLCLRMPDALEVLNTKLSQHKEPPQGKFQNDYLATIKRCITKGLVYNDLVTIGLSEYAKDLKKYSASRNGTYKYCIVGTMPSSINFTVLKFPQGEKELLIGWVTSKSLGMEQPAFKILDLRIIELFERYFMVTMSETPRGE